MNNSVAPTMILKGISAVMVALTFGIIMALYGAWYHPGIVNELGLDRMVNQAIWTWQTAPLTERVVVGFLFGGIGWFASRLTSKSRGLVYLGLLVGLWVDLAAWPGITYEAHVIAHSPAMMHIPLVAFAAACVLGFLVTLETWRFIGVNFEIHWPALVYGLLIAMGGFAPGLVFYPFLKGTLAGLAIGAVCSAPLFVWAVPIIAWRGFARKVKEVRVRRKQDRLDAQYAAEGFVEIIPTTAVRVISTRARATQPIFTDDQERRR